MTGNPERLRALIEGAWESRASVTPESASEELRGAVDAAIGGLDSGAWRVAEKRGSEWHVHQWLKKAVLLSFRITPNTALAAGAGLNFYDKVPLKFSGWDEARFSAAGARVVPPATVRRGDTWATVGSCAQIGRNVHLSGGVGIGGVLEPLQANPTIIEDNCFIGARSEIVEGVIVETGAVISMGVFIGQSTRIYDRERDEISYGRVPAGAVVVPGSLPAANGRYSLACAVIVKRVDDKTRAKTSINELLREGGGFGSADQPNRPVM
jgi:2,3,4,5-tetrahydropyridine-2-carboxylate N-succinyltransferase